MEDLIVVLKSGAKFRVTVKDVPELYGRFADAIGKDRHAAASYYSCPPFFFDILQVAAIHPADNEVK